MKINKWYKTTAFRTIAGTIFLLAGISALFQSGSIMENLATCIISLVIAFFIFPKSIQNHILNFLHQKAKTEVTIKQSDSHSPKGDDDWSNY